MVDHEGDAGRRQPYVSSFFFSLQQEEEGPPGTPQATTLGELVLVLVLWWLCLCLGGCLYGVADFRRERGKRSDNEEKIAGGFFGVGAKHRPPFFLIPNFFSIRTGRGNPVPPARPASHRPPAGLRVPIFLKPGPHFFLDFSPQRWSCQLLF